MKRHAMFRRLRRDPLVRPKVGDPAWSREGRDWTAGNCSAYRDGLICTRTGEHPGPHVAEGTTTVLAVWS